MHYYQFHIGDYHSHTAHLTEMEDLAYRRLLDFYYLHELPLTDNINELSKRIRMRAHCECIASVLLEYFELTEAGWVHHRVEMEISKCGEISKKNSENAKLRWQREREKNEQNQTPNATAMRPQCDSDATAMPPKTQDPLPTTQDPVKSGANASRFRPPTVEDVRAYCEEKGYQVDPDRFINHYESNGWMVGKVKMKKWKAAVANWSNKNGQNRRQTQPDHPRRLSPHERVRARAMQAAGRATGSTVAVMGGDGVELE